MNFVDYFALISQNEFIPGQYDLVYADSDSDVEGIQLCRIIVKTPNIACKVIVETKAVLYMHRTAYSTALSAMNISYT